MSAVVDTRDAIAKLQDILSTMPQHPGFQTTHKFADGMYVREMEIPARIPIVSKMHRKECLFFILRGDLSINANGTLTKMVCGDFQIAPPGKRAVCSAFGCRVMTVHRLDPYTEDLEEIEAQLVVPEQCSNYDFRNQLKDPALAAPDLKFLE